MRTLLLAIAVASIFGGSAQAERAVFAGGCFWCVEEAFDKVPGVNATTSGYTGGRVKNPSYAQVSAQTTGHYEAVEVEYDPRTVSYEELLAVFWRNIDPFDVAGQFCDRGSSYLSAIFVTDDEERRLAEASSQKVAAAFKAAVATAILPLQTFYPAESYHQDFHRLNPLRYRYYKWGCGRAQRLQEIWGIPAA